MRRKRPGSSKKPLNKSKRSPVLKGHGFSRAANGSQNDWALAPEGMSAARQGLVQSPLTQNGNFGAFTLARMASIPWVALSVLATRVSQAAPAGSSAGVDRINRAGRTGSACLSVDCATGAYSGILRRPFEANDSGQLRFPRPTRAPKRRRTTAPPSRAPAGRRIAPAHRR